MLGRNGTCVTDSKTRLHRVFSNSWVIQIQRNLLIINKSESLFWKYNTLYFAYMLDCHYRPLRHL